MYFNSGGSNMTTASPSKPSQAENESARNFHPIITWLDERTEHLIQRIQECEFWTNATNPHASPEITRNFMRQIYLEIVGYQPHVIEAAIAAVAQMPRSLSPRHVKSMLLHQGDEWDHGEMALRDYVGMGGDEAAARAARMSPEAFAVAGVWWMIAQQRDPFAYLGALYLFEGLTPTITGMAKGHLVEKGMAPNTLEYIEFHSTEDIKHANLVKHLISEVAKQYPDSVESMRHGFLCFEAVYPIPLWTAAYARSLNA